MNTGIVIIGLAFVLLSVAMMVTPSAAISASPANPTGSGTGADDPTRNDLPDEAAQVIPLTLPLLTMDLPPLPW